MSSNIHLEAQTTKKYDIPLTHLEYSYIEKCSNVKELEKILRVLRSGEEGRYPDLENFTEKRIETLNPKSRILRTEVPILKPGDLSSGDWNSIEEDIQSWTNSMQDQKTQKIVRTAGGQENLVEGDENLPPVRSSGIVLEGNKQKKLPTEKKNKRVTPRDYNEWNKFDIDAELEKVDSEEDKKKAKTKHFEMNGVAAEIDTTGMSQEEKDLKANREKDKGNEAFRSHDFEESVMYYSRSISLMPSSASYNNRALAYLKLEKWDQAIGDCNIVLKLEADNIKALLRRGTAHKSKKDHKKAIADLERVLALEPHNKKAEIMLSEVKKEKEEKGRKMVIEEVEDSEDEDIANIEVDKPIVNGFSTHSVENGIPGKSYSQNKTNIPGPEKLLSNITMSNNVDQDSKTNPDTLDHILTSKTPESPGLTSEKVQDTTPVCSGNDLATSAPSGLSSPHGASALRPNSVAPAEDSLPLSASASERSSLPETPVMLSDAETSPATPITHTDSQESSGEASAANQFIRPTVIQFPLPSRVLKNKEEGNKLFRSGQYAEALQQYSQAITDLETYKDQHVNMSLLLNNRAACQQKIGHCSQAISDCCRSLQLVPHGVKALLRRAVAYETIERYDVAYVDYKHVLSVDGSVDQAHQGARRCQNMLQQKLGPRSWREKIPPLVLVQPWEVPVIVDEADLHKSPSSSSTLISGQSSTPEVVSTCQSSSSPLLPSQNSSAPQHPSQNAISSSHEKLREVSQDSNSKVTSENSGEASIPQTASASDSISKEENFEALKSKGNQHVQKGEYQEAASFYTQCISLDPDQVACYTNRALCYLKLNKATEAESDCSKALTLQADNPKALYRRALSRKMLQQYKLSLQDLVDLLRLEPKNTAAQKEMDLVKKFYKEELEKLKLKKTAEQDTKVRKRMKIEEVDDEEEEEKPSRGKSSDKAKSQGKARGGKSSQPTSSAKLKVNTSEKKSAADPVQTPPVAPPIAPRLMKITPYEFCQAWNSLKPCQGIQPYAEILRQVAPADLPSVISNKLDGQMLQIIVRCVYGEMVLKGEVDMGYQILDNLCQVPRFSTVSMFMSSKEKKEVSGVLNILSKTSSSAYTSSDVLRLKKEYSVK